MQIARSSYTNLLEGQPQVLVMEFWEGVKIFPHGSSE